MHEDELEMMRRAPRSGRPEMGCWSRVGVALVALASLAGCGAGQLADRYRRSHRDCMGAIQLVQRPDEPGVFDASGCGDDVIYRSCIVAVNVGIAQGPSTANYGSGGPSGSACRTNLRSEAVDRFVHSTGCGASEVQVVDLTGGQLGIRGCGRRQIYLSTVSGWILNADVSDFGFASAP